MLLRYATGVLIAVLITGCGSRASIDPAISEQGAGLPSIAELDGIKGVSWLTNGYVPPAGPIAQENSWPEYSTQGAARRFDQTQFSWAIYRLENTGSVMPTVQAEGIGDFWLLAADYEAGCWAGAVQKTVDEVQLDLGTLDYPLSPGGFLYIAILGDYQENARLDVLFVFKDIPEDPGENYYYVDHWGDDFHAGTAEQPWRTLQHAADIVEPGDTVIVRSDPVYNFSGFDLRVTGTVTEPVIFQAEPGVTISSSNPVTADGINIENSSYVQIYGFTVNGVERAGIRVAESDNIAIIGCRVRHNEMWGIFSGFTDYLRIEQCECVHSLQQHGIYVSNSGDYPIIRRNVVCGNLGCGIHMNGDISMGGDGVISEAMVDANIIFQNGTIGGSAINCDGVQDSVIVNNLVFENMANGIALFQLDGGEPSTGNLVINNTVIMPVGSYWAMNAVLNSTGNSVFNNIFLHLGGYNGSMHIDPGCLPGFVGDYNVVMDRFTDDDGQTVYTLSEWQTLTGQEANSIVATPAELFGVEHADLNDFHLLDGCPAMDNGTATDAPPLDVEGNQRPQGAADDIGAYEYTEW